jgi:hypothetical protein
MCCSRWILLVLFASNSAAAIGGFILGGGIETDTGEGSGAALVAGVGISEKTWLSASVAKRSLELSNRQDLDSRFADIELDHQFDTVGIRIGAAYWGDPDVLESDDLRASLYFKNERLMLSADYEFRDFNFIIPSADFLTRREFMFDADGIGATARFRTSENSSLRIRGIRYDYSVPFRAIDTVDAARLLSVSRLSLVNSLVDNRVSILLGVDRGDRRWEIDLSSWESAIMRSRTNSITLRYLTPLTDKTDIEFGLGYDDSELYGGVTFLSLYLYFYGGN